MGEAEKLDDGWPESVEEDSERYKYEDLIAWNMNDDALHEETMVQTTCEK